MSSLVSHDTQAPADHLTRLVGSFFGKCTVNTKKWDTHVHFIVTHVGSTGRGHSYLRAIFSCQYVSHRGRTPALCAHVQTASCSVVWEGTAACGRDHVGHKWTEQGNSSVPKLSPTPGALEQQMGLARVAPAAGMEGNVLDGCLGGA